MTSRSDVCPICGMKSCDVGTESDQCAEGLRRYGMNILLPQAIRAGNMRQKDIEDAYVRLSGDPQLVSDTVAWLKWEAIGKTRDCVMCGKPFEHNGTDSIYCSEYCVAEMHAYRKRSGFRPPWIDWTRLAARADYDANPKDPE